MEIITNNYEWIFSGVGVLIIGYIITFFLPNKNQKQDIPITNTPNSNTNTNSFVVNNIMGNTNQIDK